MKKTNLTIVGSLNMDLVVRVPHLPEPGETILGRDYHTIPGGKGANQAVAASRLGATVSMVGRVGRDAFGGLLRKNLLEEGIDDKHVRVDPEADTGIAMITVDDSGSNSIVVASGANLLMTVQDVRLALQSLHQIDALLLQLESPLDCVLESARLAHARGAITILNPAPAHPLSMEIYDNIDVLVPNENETSLLTGMPVDSLRQAELAGRRLIEAGARNLVITLGGRGALILEAGQSVQHIPAHPVKVLDTTAAGDAFVAGLAVGLAEGMSLLEAARLGNWAGAISVTRLGAQPSLPTRAEVERASAGN